MNLSHKMTLLSIGFFALSHMTHAQSLTVLSFNIDVNRARTEEGYGRDSFPELRINARMPRIIAVLEEIIDEEFPDIIQIQEARDFKTKHGDRVAAVAPLVKFLTDQGYNVSTEQYNLSDSSMTYITATKKEFIIDGHKAKYLTKTEDSPTDHSLPMAEIKDNNFGEEFERCVFITQMHDVKGQKYFVFNVHLLMTLLSRLESCKLLRKWAHAIVARDPKVKIIMTGDFNTFPQWGGPEQLSIMTTDSVLEEVSKTLILPNEKQINTSFIAFLPDFSYHEQEALIKAEMAKFPMMDPQTRRAAIVEVFTNNCQAFGHALGGQLDRVYQYGFKSGVSILIPTPQFDDFNIDLFSEQYVKSFILRHAFDSSPAFASDHQPVLTKLEF